MKPGITLLFLLSMLATSAQRGDTERMNPPYRNKENPFLLVLGMEHLRISLSRDSTRVPLDDGGWVDVILDQKRLSRFTQYDREGRAMDSGDLRNGTGRVRFVSGPHATEAAFTSGVLNGPVVRSDLRNGAWVPMMRAAFENGLLHGEVRHQSIPYPQYLAVLERYEHGIIQVSETYGRRNWLSGSLLFLVKPMLDTDKVCSRTVYVDGKPRPTECLLTRKCRLCGM